MINLDLWFNGLMQSIQTPFGVNIMSTITHLGDAIILVPLSIILLTALYSQKRIRTLDLVTITLFLSVLTSEALKYLINRPRPFNALILETDPSFPSGHTLMSTIFFLLLIFVYKDEIKNKFLKSLFIALCTLTFLTVSFSRLYLNVHWLTDVIASFAIATFWFTLFYHFHENKKPNKNKARRK